MIAHRKQILLTGLLVAAMAALMLWAMGQLASARMAVASATEDFVACEQLAASIKQLRERPSLAGANEWQTTELAKRIELAAKTAQIDAAALVRITPQPARQLGDGPYREKSTELVLRQVTLKQLVVFLHALTANGTGLRLSAIRMLAPREQAKGEHWTVETTVSYLIYAPAKSIQERMQ